METTALVEETDPWVGLSPIRAEDLYATVEDGITHLDMAAKLEHPILEVNVKKTKKIIRYLNNCNLIQNKIEDMNIHDSGAF